MHGALLGVLFPGTAGDIPAYNRLDYSYMRMDTTET